MRNRLQNTDPEALLRECDAAEFLDISVRTLQAWRCQRKGPDYCLVGRAVRYRRADIANWLNERRQSCAFQRQPESAAAIIESRAND